MPEFVSVRQDGNSKTVVTVTKERAEALGLKALNKPAVDRRGRPLPPRQAEEKAAPSPSSTTAAETNKEGSK